MSIDDDIFDLDEYLEGDGELDQSVQHARFERIMVYLRKVEELEERSRGVVSALAQLNLAIKQFIKETHDADKEV